MNNPWIVALGAGLALFFLQKIWDRLFSAQASVVAIVRYNKFEIPPSMQEKLNFEVLRMPSESVSIEVTNSGKQTARSMELNVTDAILACIEGSEFKLTNSSINIGDLQPRKSKTITLWTKWPHVENYSEVLLTYENGVSKVLFEKRYIQGRFRKKIKNYGFPVFIFLMSLLWAFSSLYIATQK